MLTESFVVVVLVLLMSYLTLRSGKRKDTLTHQGMQRPVGRLSIPRERKRNTF